MALTKNWFLDHVPAPGSERPYKPMAPSDWEAPGDLCGLGGSHDTGAQLRSMHGAAAREERRLERQAR